MIIKAMKDARVISAPVAIALPTFSSFAVINLPSGKHFL
jgi:hypothetical protein